MGIPGPAKNPKNLLYIYYIYNKFYILLLYSILPIRHTIRDSRTKCLYTLLLQQFSLCNTKSILQCRNAKACPANLHCPTDIYYFLSIQLYKLFCILLQEALETRSSQQSVQPARVLRIDNQNPTVVSATIYLYASCLPATTILISVHNMPNVRTNLIYPPYSTYSNPAHILYSI